jgi:hypothetical protein
MIIAATFATAVFCFSGAAFRKSTSWQRCKDRALATARPRRVIARLRGSGKLGGELRGSGGTDRILTL